MEYRIRPSIENEGQETIENEGQETIGSLMGSFGADVEEAELQLTKARSYQWSDRGARELRLWKAVFIVMDQGMWAKQGGKWEHERNDR